MILLKIVEVEMKDVVSRNIIITEGKGFMEVEE